MIRKDDKLKIKPEWQDPGDSELIFIALEDEDGGRVRIGAPGILHSFMPNQVVRVSMVEVQ
jgi:hypothetical protein